LDQPGGTATNHAISGLHEAGKTGTADNGYFAAFAGYTPALASYTSVFNPLNPIRYNMVGSGSCYRDLSGPTCPGPRFGAQTQPPPAHIPGERAPAPPSECSFLRSPLGPMPPYVRPPSSYFSLGNGLGAPKTNLPKKPGKGGPGQGGGGPSPSPSPSTTPSKP